MAQLKAAVHQIKNTVYEFTRAESRIQKEKVISGKQWDLPSLFALRTLYHRLVNDVKWEPFM